ncbi:ABC transporter permease [Ramlibacter rhizophilus]|uniref:ABC transporter permease n=1 Tax=Ramlibacter rhizophilus TaxID=1781167 RepID=UPI0019810B5C|nr:ABC transporter permease [Ramlibacter rhizophilus]
MNAAAAAPGHRPLALVLAALVVLPLGWTALSAVGAGLAPAAWLSLAQAPQLPRALGLSLFTGLAATALSLLATAWLLSLGFAARPWGLLTRMLAPLLATPHAAFAIGVAFLIAPSGWILRALSPWATGFALPPPWSTTQDPWGLALVLALVGKEVPFLLWVAVAQLQRPDAGARWARELQLAQTWGYGRSRAWWRVVWPQLWPRLGAPLAAVLAYSLTVVDMALVIGPTAPPTAAVLAWEWLRDADPAANARGAALAWLLAGCVALLALLPRPLRPVLARGRRRVDGERGGRDAGAAAGWLAVLALPVAYLAVLAVLAVGSVAGVWPFPDVWPRTLRASGWQSVAASAGTLWTSLGLALAAAAAALAWSMAWLEAAPPRWDAALRRLAYLPLLLPAIVWVIGLHRLSLAWGLEARWAGLWLAHALAALPYVLIALSPAYQGFDARHAQLAASLGRSHAAFLLRVKWPLLRAALAAAFAVGFAVSIAQYLPTLFVGAGRFATVTTEAVALASGGQRSLLAAYAWLQWLLPAGVFALAAALGRPRRFAPVPPLRGAAP